MFTPVSKPGRPHATIIVPGLRTPHSTWERFKFYAPRRVYLFDYNSRGTVRNALSFLRDRTWISKFSRSARVKQLADLIETHLNEMEKATRAGDPSAYIELFCHSHGCVLTHRALEWLAARRSRKLPIRVTALAPPMFIASQHPKFQLDYAINYINEDDWIWKLHWTRKVDRQRGVHFTPLKRDLSGVPRDTPFALCKKNQHVLIVIRDRNRTPISCRGAFRSHTLACYLDVHTDPYSPRLIHEASRCVPLGEVPLMAKSHPLVYGNDGSTEFDDDKPASKSMRKVPRTSKPGRSRSRAVLK